MGKRKGQQVGGTNPPISPIASFKDCDSPALPPQIVRLEITPTHSQYKQLCDDLRELRRRGAETNTVAIIEAVHAATSHKIEARSNEWAEERMRAPRPRNRR
jgi:phosphopantothenoylcysteine synthetase/decarboxylase